MAGTSPAMTKLRICARTLRARKQKYPEQAPGISHHFDLETQQASRLAGNLLAERSLRSGEPCDRHAIRRTRHVVQSDLVTEIHRRRIAAVLTADSHLQIAARGTATLHRDLHQFAHALAIDRDERIDLKDTARG